MEDRDVPFVVDPRGLEGLPDQGGDDASQTLAALASQPADSAQDIVFEIDRESHKAA